MNDIVCHLDVVVDKKNIKDGVLKVAKLIRPDWNTTNITTKIFTEGITNRVMQVYQNGDPKDIVMFRIYGEETQNIIDHDNEIKTMKFLNSHGLCAQLYAVFKNGLAYQYLPGITLDKVPRNNTKVFCMVAEKMAKLHQQLPAFVELYGGEKLPIIWNKIKTFLSCFSCTSSRKLDLSAYSSSSEELLCGKDLLIELDWLMKHLEEWKSPIVLCHNDLLMGNLVYNHEKDTVDLIDFEYAGPNHQAYDIANYFCEISGTDKWKSYPDESFRRCWVISYLKAFHSSSDFISESSITKLLETVEHFRLASHFFCATWGLYQSVHSSLAFDFNEYSSLRFEEYYRVKKELSLP